MDYRRLRLVILLFLCCLTLSIWSVPEVIVRNEAVSLRTDIAGDKLGALVRPGQRLQVLNKIGRWYYTQTAAKEVGWIFEDNVQLDIATYTPVNVHQFSPLQVYALATREINAGGPIQSFQWTASGEKLVFLYRTEYGEVVVNGTEAKIEEDLVSTVFTTNFPEPKFLPPGQKAFNGQVSLSDDEKKLFVGGSPLNLLFLDENLEIRRRERIKVRPDMELYGGVSFSPKNDRAVVFNLVAEELDGLVDNLCLINVPELEYEIVKKTILDWNEAPAWAPDGLSFLFGGEGNIYRVDDNLKITKFAEGKHFSFSADGKVVIYSREGEIFLQSVGGKVGRHKTFGQHPSWHPEGSKIAYDNLEGLWIEDIIYPEKKRLQAIGSRPVWSPKGDRLVCQTASDTLAIVYLSEVLDINYVYRLNLGRRDGLTNGMLLSVYRPQLGLRNQTVGYNQESWQGFIRVISAQAGSSLVKQEKMTRVIGREEVVVLPSLEKLGRLVRLADKKEDKTAKTAALASLR